MLYKSFLKHNYVKETLLISTEHSNPTAFSNQPHTFYSATPILINICLLHMTKNFPHLKVRPIKCFTSKRNETRELFF